MIMNANKDYCSIAFVSGKGGVGKTTIVANIAWLISNAPAKVLIVDLDFQNQGCTGLFSSRFKLGNSNALESLQNDQKEKKQVPSLSQITENLQFLPSVSVAQKPERKDAILDVPKDIYGRLDRLLNYLHELYSIDCFVLDCHGGIDETSIAASGICDYTMVVTEADTVTFAGTLALIESYYYRYSTSDRKPNIEYIINRIPPKYKWKGLDRLYQDFLGRRLGRFTKSQTILSYIPVVGYLADSFGDYPFQVELSPSAMFTRKLELIIYSLFHDSHPKLVYKKVQKRFQRKRYTRKIHKRLISLEMKNIRTLFTSYALICLLFPIFIAYSIYTRDKNFEEVAIQVGIFSITIFYLLINSLIKAFSYFREKLKFQKAFLRVLPDEKTLWQRLKLGKLRMLYLCALVVPLSICLFAIYIIFISFFNFIINLLAYL